ncbi:nucleoside triphosphate pyrophosphohydrolase [Clostridium sp. SHJSY1]|uniref:nucleoside triphosphate pyrophosphohydrolase n=1 Tax=Clostridium sp. SHJSY1 TaxID=2942483 RepID=UPI0028750F68|nr:nucleoside triphosphate pyrophosphohydrolase [Clostridium sp. SHJSY1]MDS0525302.1 nucleoside triphosphate pyrophosphohydrolase [Clostridium sp. SHJSY1]
MIKIVGLGPGSINDITMGAVQTLKEANNVFLRTERHPVVEYLKKENINFVSYDYVYEKANDFDEVYNDIARDLIDKYSKCKELVYAVPGNPLESEKSVTNLIDLCKENSIEYHVIPAISFLDIMMNKLEIDFTDGIRVVDAFDISNEIFDKRVGTIITQVYNQFIASEVKIRLGEYYNDETEVLYCKAIGIEGKERVKRIPLYELDMQEDMDYLTYVYIPKDIENKKDVYDLINIIDILRGENGCPWDREQTHDSIKSAIIEESYEVYDAIINEDDNALIEELGDVLLQVIFHSVIGKEDGYFNFGDVIQGICDKMIYRHPHVFGDLSAETSKDVLNNWDELKKKEKNFNTLTEELKGIAKSLPALVRANKVQNKAKKVGFDFKNVDEAIEKVKEELNEVLSVYKSENKAKITEEVGDLIFSCVNICRFLEIDSEEALNFTIEKFINRFNYIEEKSIENKTNIGKITVEEMNILWEEAKKLKK